MIELKNNNKVKFLPLEVENDFMGAQYILEQGEVTENIDAYSAYEKRVDEGKKFVGTYVVNVDRLEDYKRFINVLHNAQCIERHKVDREIKELKEKVLGMWKHGLFGTREQADNSFLKAVDALKKENKILSFRKPTFDEWKTGKYKVDEKRTVRLGKALRKAGFSQVLIDFYSEQVKTEKTVYLTISDRVHHIAGMSYYAKIGSWDGYQGTSCQDPRHEYEECIRLAGSLHDDKLYIAMLHDSIDDLKDMENKLLARTMLRLVHVDNMPCLVATTYYGNNETKSLLHKALEQLAEYDIYTFYGMDTPDEIKERANGAYEMSMFDDVHIYEEIEEEIEVDCLICGGSGTYTVWAERLEREIDVDCPHCGGSGTVEEYITHYVDEWIEVEDMAEVLPYNEGYIHCDSYISMMINIDYIREKRNA